jgi:hypothetical protein
MSHTSLTERVRDAYLRTALWAETDDAGEPLDAGYTAADFAADARAEALGTAARFLAALDGGQRAAVAAAPERAGHDLWLTQGRHGAGFWDGAWGDQGDALTEIAQGLGEPGVYVDDDGALALA